MKVGILETGELEEGICAGNRKEGIPMMTQNDTMPPAAKQNCANDTAIYHQKPGIRIDCILVHHVQNMQRQYPDTNHSHSVSH